MKATLVLVLAVACSSAVNEPKLQSSASDFFKGLFEGLKRNPNEQSPCINSFVTLDQSFQNFIGSLVTQASLEYILTALKDYSTKLTETTELCEMKSLTEQVLRLLSAQEIEFLAIRIFTKVGFFTETYEAFKTAFQKKYYFEAGYFGGQMLSRLLDFYI